MFTINYKVVLYNEDCYPVAIQGFEDFNEARQWGEYELITDLWLYGYIIFDNDNNHVMFFRSRN